MVDDEIYAAKVVDGLENVVYVNRCITDANCICLKDLTCLVVRQTTALHVVGVIRQVDLCAVIDAALQPRSLLLPQHPQQSRDLLCGLTSFGQNRISRNVPCLSGQEGPLNLSVCAIIADCPLRNAILLGKLYHRYILLHITLSASFLHVFATKVQFFADIGKKRHKKEPAHRSRLVSGLSQKQRRLCYKSSPLASLYLLS